MSALEATYTENSSTSYKSTWNVQYYPHDIYAYGEYTTDIDEDDPPVYAAQVDEYVAAKYDLTTKNRAYANIEVRLYATDTSGDEWLIERNVYRHGTKSGNNPTSSWSPNVYSYLEYSSGSSTMDPTAIFFDSSNPTTSRIPLTTKTYSVELRSAYVSGSTTSRLNSYTSSSETIVGSNSYLYYMYKPDVSSSGYTISPQSGVYAGLTYITYNISATAHCGGNFSSGNGSITIELGGSSSTITSYSSNFSGTITVLAPETPGVYVPTLTATDSRGISRSVSLSPITVTSNVFNIQISADRIDMTTHKLDDEGVGCLVTATIDYVEPSIVHLRSIDTKIDGVSAQGTAWYYNWNNVDGFSDLVDFNDFVESTPELPITLYGLMRQGFDTGLTYDISCIAEARAGQYNTIVFTSSEMHYTLPQAFYLLAAKAGGHGLGVGTKPKTDDFHVDMDAYFYRNIMSVSMAGMIQMFGGTTAPDGWLMCNGQEVLISSYPELYNAIGDNFGTASDNLHFMIPDFRGRTPVGVGTGTATDATEFTLNESGGQEGVTLTSAQSGMPSHGHGFTQPTVSGGAHSHTMTAEWSSGSGSDSGYTKTANRSLGNKTVPSTGSSHTHTVSGGAVSDATAKNATAAHTNMQPYRGINFIIATGRMPV